MNPYLVGKSRHCPKCRVDIASLNCPRCGKLTEVGPHAQTVRRVRYDHRIYVAPDYVVLQDQKGRKRTRIPKEES